MSTAEHNLHMGAISAEDGRKVRAQLERLLESHQFRNSRRYPALLRFLVEEALEGRGDILKERLIGIHVFGRPTDYDTAADPIVRVTIAEVRKRIAQYYHDEEHDAEIRIELITGRYEPEFRLRRDIRADAHAEPAPEAEPVPIFIDTTPPVAAPQPPGTTAQGPLSRSKPRLAWLGGLLAVLLVAGFFGLQSFRQSSLDEFWSPILSPRRTVLFCLPTSATSRKGPTTANAATHPGPGTTFLDHESLGENIVYSDMLSMLQMTNVLITRHADYRVRTTDATTLDDLRHGPSVLIGGLDNDWTLRALKPLPYRFAGSDEVGFWIYDSKTPNDKQWYLDLKMQYASVTRDYAVIARLHNDQTGEPEVIVAGIGMSGTAAAGEMVGNERLMQELQRRVGPGFKDRDFEVVLSTDVVNGIAGSPKILASATW